MGLVDQIYIYAFPLLAWQPVRYFTDLLQNAKILLLRDLLFFPPLQTGDKLVNLGGISHRWDGIVYQPLSKMLIGHIFCSLVDIQTGVYFIAAALPELTLEISAVRLPRQVKHFILVSKLVSYLTRSARRDGTYAIAARAQLALPTLMRPLTRLECSKFSTERH